MGLTKNPFFRLGLMAAFAFLLGFSYDYHLPKLESFLLLEVERLSQEHAPARIWAQKLHFHLFPLGIVLEDVKVLPQKPLDRYLAPAELKEAGAQLAILPLLRGEIRLSQVFIRDSELNLFLKNDLFENKPGAKKLKFNFENLYNLPIDELVLDRVRLQGSIEPKNMVFRTDNLKLDIENRYQSLFVELNAPSVQFKPSGPRRPLRTEFELRTLIEAHEVQVSAFKLRADDSFVVASGHFNGDITRLHFENGSFDARAKLNMPDFNVWENAFRDKTVLPPMQGHAEIDFGMEVRGGKGYKVATDIDTENLKIDKFKIGKIHTHLDSDLKSVHSRSIAVENEAGRFEIDNFGIDLDSSKKVSGELKVSQVELGQFLKNLGIHKAPLLVNVAGHAACAGDWGPTRELNCHSQANVSRVFVHADDPKKTPIVDVLNGAASGDVKVTDHDVTYKADLNIGAKSKGHSEGVINYRTGFKIAYQGDNVDFSDVKNLANLKLQGSAKITGTTEGTADWATLSMHVDGKDFWLEDYPLGAASAQVTYKKGHLTFTGLQGQYGNTRYNGDVNLDLKNDRLQLAGTIPFADMRDVKSFFQRKVDLPFSVAGTGQGKIEAQGPLRFRDLTYTLRSSFYRGEIADETFDELVFNVSAKDGHVQTDRVTITKATGVADVKGRISPEGAIDTVVVGRGLRLEQSENILNLGLDMQGLADFTLLIRGQLPHPRIELNGRLSRVVLADQPAEDSVFKLNFLSDRLEGSGQFLGTKLLADITYPYDDQAPFRVKLKASQLDVTNLFSIISKTAKQLDFSTSISGAADLSSPRGGFWTSSGQVEFQEFTLRKGAQSLKAPKTMRLSINHGEINSDNVTVSSGENYLKLDMVGLTRDHLNASLNGKLDLSLLGLFTPFISDLRGNMALSMDLKGRLDKPQLSGSAYIEKGYAKFADFVHPFSNVRADLLFNDNQILLNSVQGELGGGKFNGDGRITFAGEKRPIDIKGAFNDVRLNVPDGFHTRGSGSLTISGNGFPYTLGINYTVTGGEVTYELGQDSGDANTVKASPYLPKFLNQESFHPFTFDIDATLKNPINVNNSLAQTPVNGHIAAKGTPDHLLLTGTLTPSPGGKIFFHDTPFEIGSAYIEYTDAPPSKPKVFLTANTRVTEIAQDESSGQTRTTEKPYDVNLLVQGRGPLPDIILTSQPPLPQQDIVSLLTLGVTTGAMDNKTSSDYQAASSSAALGATLLQKAGGKKLKESLGVDVKVSSSQPTPETASSPKVTLSKQWTPKFGASASSTLQANPTNDVKLEYKMNKSMSVIGSWDGREYVQGQQDAARNVFGLDLEYKLQFK